MLDVSTIHPFQACAAFAVRWLTLLAGYDLAQAESLLDGNDSGAPLAVSFPPPEGFTYCHPDEARNWTMHIVAAGRDGLDLHFEVPFAEREFRPMLARFHLRRRGDHLEVRFEALVPS